MDIPLYMLISTFIIMIWHFAFSTRPRDFGLFQMIGIFVIGGAVGFYMSSIEAAVLISIVLSLILI
jgi:hypothetical protein